MNIPYVNLAAQHQALEAELLEAARGVIRSGQFILGPAVEEFERRFAAHCGAQFAVGVNSGTDALMLALKALGVGPGDEVITVPNSFVATATSIVLAGAKPVFVDVGPDYNLEPAQLPRAMSPRTRAILPVHLTGRPADMPAIMDFARGHGLAVIEDCAQAVGAEIAGRKVGSWGDLGCFSLHPLKTLNACGDGGVIVSNDATMAGRLKVLRNIGQETRDRVVAWSGNSRLDALQAALLLVKMNHLDAWTETRRGNAQRYRGLLARTPQVVMPVDPPASRCVYHTFVVQCERRNELQKHLAEHGIGTVVHYPTPIHLQPVAAELGYRRGDFPVAEAQAERILSLPIYPELTAAQLAFVAEAIGEFYGGGRLNHGDTEARRQE